MDMFFDRHAPVYKTSGNLPHWSQHGKLELVTFRLADSMPQEVVKRYFEELETWKKQHPEHLQNGNETKLKHVRRSKFDKYLDAGYGHCLLGNSVCREVVAASLFHFNGEKYKLHAFAIMPNHVHILMEMIGECTVQKVVPDLKRFTSHELKRILELDKTVWQKGYFDRIVRNESVYRRVMEYIKHNALTVPAGKRTLYK